MEVSASRAAEILGVSRMQISRLIESGGIRARRFGNAWLIDVDSLHRYEDLRPDPGRPLRPDAAWGLVLAARPSSIEQARDVAVRSRRRARRLAGRVIPGELDGIRGDPRIVCSGISAAYRAGAAVRDDPPYSLYMKESHASDLIGDYGFVDQAQDVNVILRVVDDDEWVFDGEQLVSPWVALVDLVDDRDERSARELLAALR